VSGRLRSGVLGLTAADAERVLAETLSSHVLGEDPVWTEAGYETREAAKLYRQVCDPEVALRERPAKGNTTSRFL
jgi:hypothetical protein